MCRYLLNISKIVPFFYRLYVYYLRKLVFLELVLSDNPYIKK